MIFDDESKIIVKAMDKTLLDFKNNKIPFTNFAFNIILCEE